ncbi:response regulator [Autumnicola psychrophila]|uniref:Response regulator n=1 Tax=Autumnicola psychrophila TaxID=3075592 RepID=A0ABU3DUQ7_9FLAO|nr:response regulator [Zunongwangia sp. F225]MDT0687437.1 response regulator [Zunongwangia sp. F225]
MPKLALVIQEDIIILKILERLAISNSYSCKAISSLSHLDIEDQNTNFDVIISDILFDGIAPLEFVSQVQEVILHRNLLIVSNMGQEKIKQETMALKGIAGFFEIPFDLDEIEKLMQTY